VTGATSTAPASSSGARLVARTERLDLDVDLLAVAGDDGPLWTHGRQGFAGQGEAMRITVPPGDPAAAAASVHDALDTIEVHDEVGEPGCGPVALGGLPFDPRRPGTLVVPELLVGRSEDGTRWLTTVGPPGAPTRFPTIVDRAVDGDGDGDVDVDEDGDGDRVGRDLARSPTEFRVTSPRSPEDWCAALVAARRDLRDGAARKVVLAREILISTDRPLRRRAILDQLRRTYPTCMLFAADSFIGASPELLVARSGDVVRSHPMAGTAPRGADPSTDSRLAAGLLASAKDQIEHRFTIDMVHETLLPWCSYLDEEAEPSIVAMANVQHLATLVEGRLSSPPASVVELMRALHPTPAVNGSPRQAALDLIATYEGIDRGRFGGPVGWVDAAGNGAWTVGIRSAELDGNQARLFAGVGVVADSDPAAELAETRAKFQALLGAILRP
jgi:menaquinone-specific isochorismate synthase